MNTENDYVRIDGPSVRIELSLQPARSLAGIHPKSVWRHRKADYGCNKWDATLGVALDASGAVRPS